MLEWGGCCRMDLKEIEVFLKVMEYKKLTAAADSLGMT